MDNSQPRLTGRKDTPLIFSEGWEITCLVARRHEAAGHWNEALACWRDAEQYANYPELVEWVREQQERARAAIAAAEGTKP